MGDIFHPHHSDVARPHLALSIAWDRLDDRQVVVLQAWQELGRLMTVELVSRPWDAFPLFSAGEIKLLEGEVAHFLMSFHIYLFGFH